MEEQLNNESRLVQQQLEEYSYRSGMPITQEGGQRRYGPPMDPNVPVPAPGSEVFVANLPQNCYEPELIPIFETIGKIYEMRLMINYSGNNRGFCFVRYTNPTEAQQAILQLDNYELRKGCTITVTRSRETSRLFLSQIPLDKNEEEVKAELQSLIDGEFNIIIPPPINPDTGIKNRGYAFLDFGTHKEAACAKKRLAETKVRTSWGNILYFKWATPIIYSKGLIIKNLSPETSNEALFSIFNEASFNAVIKVTRPHDNTAHVSFTTYRQALVAKRNLNRKRIDGKVIQIKFDEMSPDGITPPREEVIPVPNNELQSVERHLNLTETTEPEKVNASVQTSPVAEMSPDAAHDDVPEQWFTEYGYTQPTFISEGTTYFYGYQHVNYHWYNQSDHHHNYYYYNNHYYNDHYCYYNYYYNDHYYYYNYCYYTDNNYAVQCVPLMTLTIPHPSWQSNFHQVSQ